MSGPKLRLLEPAWKEELLLIPANWRLLLARELLNALIQIIFKLKKLKMTIGLKITRCILLSGQTNLPV